MAFFSHFTAMNSGAAGESDDVLQPDRRDCRSIETNDLTSGETNGHGFFVTHTQRFLYWNERSLAKSLAFKSPPFILLMQKNIPFSGSGYVFFHPIGLKYGHRSDDTATYVWTLDDFGYFSRFFCWETRFVFGKFRLYVFGEWTHTQIYIYI